MYENVQTTLQQPEPTPPKRLYASFLKDFVDPAHPSPCSPSVHTFISEWLESIGLDQDTRCQLGSYLHDSDCDLTLPATKRARLEEEPEQAATVC